MKLYALGMALLLLPVFIKAQNPVTTKEVEKNRTSNLHNIQALKVGDKMPDVPVAKIVNGPKKKARIGDFNHQLLILDFMDTYCGSCIDKLPEITKLQQQFGDKVAIFPVTWEKQNYIAKWLSDPRRSSFNKLPWIVEDTLLSDYFKHKIVSHIAWIYNGKVIAITEKEFITAPNIQKVLDGQAVNWPVKDDDFYFDPNEPIFNVANAGIYDSSGNFFNYSGITGFREGLDYKGGVAYDSARNRTYFYNFSILDSYIALWAMVTNNRIFMKHPGRTILEVKDPYNYTFDPTDFINGKGKGFFDNWRREHQFCFEMITNKPLEEKERLHKAIEELNHRLGINGRIEKRMVKCLVLVQTPGGVKADSTIWGKNMVKIAVSTIPFFFFDMQQKYPPAINETNNYKGYVWLSPPSGSDSIEDMRKKLQTQGLDLVEAERELDVLVITENDYKKQ